MLSNLVSLILALALIASFSTMGIASDAGGLTPLTKYAEPVIISVGRMNNAGGLSAPGDDSENNAYTRMLKDEMNIAIDVKNGFDADGNDYETTLALRVASDTLPDTFRILASNKSQALFRQLLEGNKLAALTDIHKTPSAARRGDTWIHWTSIKCCNM